VAEPGGPVEINFGQSDSSAIIAEARPRVSPPPPRAAVPAAGVGAAAPAGVRALVGALRGAPASWIAALLPTAATIVLMVIVLRHGGAGGRMAAAPPAAAPTPASVAAACTTPVVPSTVEMALDSHPQGALVTTAAAPGERARPLGETPFVLRLPRGETQVTLVMSKRGFAPVTFKVVPNHDKDVATRLERGSGGGGPKLVASAPRHVLTSNLPAGSLASDRTRRPPR
jgi:hypothetical protein